ncbi:MAG: PKD domain-containing protein, partial [Methanothrix sp.]|nr:PKD domain-containing protein [Methanothrix sp.]
RWIATMIRIGVFALILLALTMQPAISADWPDCKFQCQANDVIVQRLWLGDDSGEEISSPAVGEERACLLWATFRNNANTPRYAAILLADLYLGGTLSQSFYDDGLCALDEIEAKSTVDHPLCNIVWTGGDDVLLKRLVLSWETAKGTGCSNANRKCSNRNTKCYGGQEAEMRAEVPIIASFEIDAQDCSSLVSFHDRTTDGSGPYTYSWDFGDGAFSTRKDPDHTYGHLGDYLVRLQVRDSTGRMASVSQMLAINACTCAIIGQDHACLSKTETYRVRPANSINGAVHWYLDGREIYGQREQELRDGAEESLENDSIDIAWQTYEEGTHDLTAYISDASSVSDSKLWAACNMTINVTPEPLAVIRWVA